MLYPKYLPNTLNPKPEELGSWNFERKVGQSGGASQWRVCYQRGLPHLVFKPTIWISFANFLGGPSRNCARVPDWPRILAWTRDQSHFCTFWGGGIIFFQPKEIPINRMLSMSFLLLPVFPDLCVVQAVTNGPHPISHNTHHCQDCLLQQQLHSTLYTLQIPPLRCALIFFLYLF